MKKCSICNQKNLKKCFTVDNQQIKLQPEGNKIPFKEYSILRCNNCGAEHLSPKPSADKLKTIFNTLYAHHLVLKHLSRCFLVL